MDIDILNIAIDNGNVDKGKALFNKCPPCHGKEGEGDAIGPNLADDYWIYGGRKVDIARITIEGVIEKGMPSFGRQLSPMS